MTTQSANRRFHMAFFPAMALFMAGSLFIAWSDDNLTLPAWGVYALAMVPIGALLFTFWVHWRFVLEVDEFLRLIQIKGVIAGLAVVMAIATGWGYLESYADAPALPIFWLNPIYWSAYGIVTAIITKREGGYF